MTTLADFDSLEAAKAYTETATQKLSADRLDFALFQLGLTELFEAKETVFTRTVMRTLERGGEFNFIAGDAIGDQMVAQLSAVIADSAYSEFSDNLQQLLVFCQTYCNQTVYPFAESSLLQWNMAKGIYTAIPVVADGYIKIVLEQDLDEACTITFWDVVDGCMDRNLCKPIRVQAKASYIHQLSGIKVVGAIEARLPFASVSFTAEAL